jgi:hypothetical protein
VSVEAKAVISLHDEARRANRHIGQAVVQALALRDLNNAHHAVNILTDMRYRASYIVAFSPPEELETITFGDSIVAEAHGAGAGYWIWAESTARPSPEEALHPEDEFLLHRAEWAAATAIYGLLLALFPLELREDVEHIKKEVEKAYAIQRSKDAADGEETYSALLAPDFERRDGDEGDGDENEGGGGVGGSDSSSGGSSGGRGASGTVGKSSASADSAFGGGGSSTSPPSNIARKSRAAYSSYTSIANIHDWCVKSSRVIGASPPIPATATSHLAVQSDNSLLRA